MRFAICLSFLLLLLSAACTVGSAEPLPTVANTPPPLDILPIERAISQAQPTVVVTVLIPTPVVQTAVPTSTIFVPTATSTVPPTETAVLFSPTPAIEPTATYWPTVTRQILPADQAAGLIPCSRRLVAPEALRVVVTQQFGLAQTYEPADLVELSTFLDESVTRGLTLFIRQPVVEPLRQMITEMQQAGLNPSVLSAYRSYGEQSLAWGWWESQYPDRVAILSARPGYSEHQLGTTVDFGSPELDHLFHVDFGITVEGIWLKNNAHRFGFTLSYPDNTYDITGIKHEPWHFRYVGVNLAQTLFSSGQILTSWQLANLPPPCIP